MIEQLSHGHTVNSSLVHETSKIVLAGVGGNGCRMLHGLAQLHLALVALRGHGLDVVTYDPDVVSEANVGRTVFSRSDIGLHKASVLTHRINCAYGLDWAAMPCELKPGLVHFEKCHVLVTCVDSAAARRSIYKNVTTTRSRFYRPAYWIDLGNGRQHGQVVLGEFWAQMVYAADRRSKGAVLPRLPHVVDLFPQILDPSIPEDNLPSCSLQEAIESQDLFVNAHVATWALQLLWELFRSSSINRHGYFINLETGHANPLTVESSVQMCAGGKA